MEKITRIKFLRRSLTGMISLRISALLGLELLFRKQLLAEAYEFPDSSCGVTEENGNRILVAYCSEFGSTAGVAEEIGIRICKRGGSVDIKRLENVEDLRGYSAVIIGSPIQYDNWMRDAIEFAGEHRDVLMRVPAAYFFTCLTLSRKSKEANQQAKGYAKKLLEIDPDVVPVGIGMFAGVLDYGKMSLFRSSLSRVVFAFLSIQEGDYRDWKTIRSWTDDVLLKFGTI